MAVCYPNSSLCKIYIIRLYCFIRDTFYIANIILFSSSIKALFIFSWIDVKPLKLGDYEFPTWTLIFGNIITFTTLLGILGWVAYELYLVFQKKKVTKSRIIRIFDINRNKIAYFRLFLRRLETLLRRLRCGDRRFRRTIRDG